VVRSVHVGFLMLLFFGLVANAAPGPRRWGWAAAAVIGFAVSFYHWIFYVELIVRRAPDHPDIVVGVVAVMLVFEGAYPDDGAGAADHLRARSSPMRCGATCCRARSIIAATISSRSSNRSCYLGTEGIYGIPTYVSSTYIFLFILFGAFLERAGMIQLFTDVAMGLVGHTRGGPAKVSVVSSGLMGTINGSGVANVVTTGQFTIPLMKRFGYRPAFAGGVEATASMGGQIMPPVMGAVAFIMAETLGVSYARSSRRRSSRPASISPHGLLDGAPGIGRQKRL
jgi:TRAP-type uncharacterized transport system fused permease subunit